MLFSIGHSNRSWDSFATLLKRHNITILLDVRRYPVSKAHPHFSKEHFETELKEEGIAYLHDPRLGGMRKPGAHELNNGWEEPAFQGYADHMESKEFRKAVEGIISLRGNVALMCAELDETRCHRQLLADYLTAKGYEVGVITDLAEPTVHRLTGFAKVQDGTLTYPSAQRKLA